MAKPIDYKCLECSKTPRTDFGRSRPDCWKPQTCRRRRSYYSDHENNKVKQRKLHVYIKYKTDRCAMCQSTELLEVHHVKPQAFGGEHSRFNTLTLCHHCHKVITKYYGIILGRKQLH